MKWWDRWIDRLGLTNRPRLRKLLIGLIGGTVVLFGVALIVLPGPAVVVIPIGLAILATEFAWARRVIRRGEEIWSHWRGKKSSLGNDAG
jgi:tellurite resistance protein TerC